MNLEPRYKANLGWCAACALTLLLQGACAEPPGVVEPETVADQPALDAGLASLAAAASADLAQRLSVDSDDIEVTESRYVTWPDSSAGCPRPGFEYLQVLTEGALIRLHVAGNSYQYHSAGGQTPFLCEAPRKVAPRPAGSVTE